VLGPLIGIIARFVDHPLARVTLALAGLVSLILFGPLSIAMLIWPDTGWFRLIGLGSVLGLCGWCMRVFLTLPTLKRHVALRWSVSLLLAAGTSTAVSMMTFFPGSVEWYGIFGAMSLAGLIMLIGSLAAWQPGPNKSFKPNPLRGSA
jgi:peptidoglycan/LPS O-acetylase OafA/YrhL